jgi:hypothetical protein
MVINCDQVNANSPSKYSVLKCGQVNVNARGSIPYELHNCNSNLFFPFSMNFLISHHKDIFECLWNPKPETFFLPFFFSRYPLRYHDKKKSINFYTIQHPKGFFLFSFVRKVDWWSFTRGLSQIWLQVKEESFIFW